MAGPDRRLLAISVAVVVIPLLVLAGIYVAIFWNDPENDRLGDTIRFALPEGEPGDRATLDLDELVEGDWDRLVISCRGTGVLLTFENDTGVVTEYNRDADVMAEPVYFDPCLDAPEPTTVLNRSEAALSLVLDDHGRWVIDRETD